MSSILKFKNGDLVVHTSNPDQPMVIWDARYDLWNGYRCRWVDKIYGNIHSFTLYEYELMPYEGVEK